MRLFKALGMLGLGLAVPSAAQQSNTLTKPLKAGTVTPGSCGIGEMFFKSNATPGANLYLCTAANTWTQIASGGALTSVFGRAGVVTAQTGDYTFGQISGVATTAQLPASIQYFQSGAGVPGGSCIAGQNAYLDTTNLDYWFCDVMNTWKKLISTTNSGPFALTGQMGSAPATPAAGLETVYLNSTDKTLHTVSDGGTDMRYAGLGETNAWGAFLQDFSASTMTIPVAAGFTTASNGGVGYDSTANQLHAAINATDAIIPTRAPAAPTNGNCVKWGPNGQLQDQGSACGGGSAPTLSTAGSGYFLPWGNIAYTNPGGSLGTNTVAWQFVCCNGWNLTVKTIEIPVWTQVASSNIAAAIYSDSSGSPGTLVAATASGASASAQTAVFVSFSSAQALTNGTVYWLMISDDTAGVGLAVGGSTVLAMNSILNQSSHPRQGVCANAATWSGGVPTFQATCGSLSSLAGYNFPATVLLP